MDDHHFSYITKLEKKKHLHGSFSYLLFQNPPIQLKCGLHRRWRRLKATHLDQSNYRANEKRKYSQLEHDLTLFIRLFQASESWAWVFLSPNWTDRCTWSQISSARSHTMRRWRYSKWPQSIQNLVMVPVWVLVHLGWESGRVWRFEGAEFEYCSTWASSTLTILFSEMLKFWKRNQKFSSEKQIKNLMEYWENISIVEMEFWNSLINYSTNTCWSGYYGISSAIFQLCIFGEGKMEFSLNFQSCRPSNYREWMFSTLISKFSSMVLQNDCYSLQFNMFTFSKHTMD
jgi:hypothetical protein